MKKYITKRNIIFAAVNVLLLILIGLCIWKCSVYSNTLLSQQAAEVWKGESKERFAQVSCFLPVDAKTDVGSIHSFRLKIDKKLVEAGVDPPEEGKLWTDAYSAKGSIQVTGDKGSSAATVLGVGGNFFLFHPYYLMSGSYIYPEDIMQDRVVLDSELAWKLFGSSSLEGMTVTINGEPFLIAGVVRRETDKFSQKAYLSDPMIFMSQTAYAQLTEDEGIDCYELAMLDPISDYAKTVLKDNFPVGKGEIVSNSTRYNFSGIYGIFKNFGNRVMRNSAVIFPYWENAARLSEEHIARLWVVMAVLGLFPLVCLVWILVLVMKWLIKKLKQGALAIKEAWEDRYGRMEKFRERRRIKKENKASKQIGEQDDVSENVLSEEALAEDAPGEEALAEVPANPDEDTLQELTPKETVNPDEAFQEFFSREKLVKEKAAKKEKQPKEKKPKRKRGYRPPQIVEEFENPFVEASVKSADVYDEKAVAMDVESIVRELMQEDK